eukprot:4998889-Alexandrium_andersonii.AAC.1
MCIRDRRRFVRGPARGYCDDEDVRDDAASFEADLKSWFEFNQTGSSTTCVLFANGGYDVSGLCKRFLGPGNTSLLHLEYLVQHAAIYGEGMSDQTASCPVAFGG